MAVYWGVGDVVVEFVCSSGDVGVWVDQVFEGDLDRSGSGFVEGCEPGPRPAFRKVTPQTTPVVDLVTVTETACRFLDKNNADILRSEAVSVLKRQKNNKSNISSDETKALKSLQRDKNIIIHYSTCR